ncbi:MULTISPECIES: hypothetical protein [Saccharopolyspora]|uniref:hypothetical protein n=1 Tax=Saccharopolyspora TaxID=1835 RepID=UPI0015876BA6|nr:hypothetical protein [Saccharopolyspora flava]
MLADPNDDPPDGLADFLAGYNDMVHTVHGADTGLRLLALRSIYTAFELIMTEEAESQPLARIASDAAMLTANLTNAYRLDQQQPADREMRAVESSAEYFLRAVTQALSDYRTSTAASVAEKNPCQRRPRDPN